MAKSATNYGFFLWSGFLRFEDLRTNPQGVACPCAAFLGVDGDLAFDTERGQHSGYRSSAMMRVFLAARSRVRGINAIQERIWWAPPGSLRERLRTQLTRPIPSLEAADRDFLEAYFVTMVPPLEEMTGLDLSPWGLSEGAHYHSGRWG